MDAIRCCVIDDEPLALKLISSYVGRTAGLELAGAYLSAEEASEAIGGGDFDAVFLDIQMPGVSGVEFAKTVPPSTRIIFVTAYSDYAVEGFRVNAIDYLLKPVSYDEFVGAVNRVRQWKKGLDALSGRDSQGDYLTVKSEYRLVRLRISDIVYVECLKDYIKIYSDGQPRPVLTLMSMKTLESMLPGRTFMRVHRSYIVNVDRITSVSRGRVTLADADIPVTDTYRQTLLDLLSGE